MSAEVIANMRRRVERVRAVLDLAHDPKMIRMLEEMIEEAEGDIAKLEAEQSGPALLETGPRDPRST